MSKTFLSGTVFQKTKPHQNPYSLGFFCWFSVFYDFIFFYNCMIMSFLYSKPAYLERFFILFLIQKNCVFYLKTFPYLYVILYL